jgi:cholesterol transport system auxiliary component
MKPMQILRPWACLPLLALAGCSVLGGDKEPVTIYAPQVRVAADPAWPQVAWQLAIVKPNAARIVDSPRINVRPTPGELQVYRGASWAQPATDMLEDALVQGFQDSGRIAGVARVGDGIRADYKLAVDLRRFEADYAGGDVPAATIELNAKLLDNLDQHVVASRTLQVAQPAGGTDVAAVSTAFQQALTQVSTELVGWTLRAGQQDADSVPPATPPRSAR